MEGGEEVFNVKLNLYDLSEGKTGYQYRQVGLVVFDREYHLTRNGITTFIPSGTELGDPSRDQNIGETHLPYSVFLDYTVSLAKTKYKCMSGTAQSILSLQIEFVEDCCQFLCGQGVPKFLLETQILKDDADLEKTLTKLSRGGISLISTQGVARLHEEDDIELEEIDQQIQSIRENQRILEEKRNLINKNEKKAKKKKCEERIGRKGWVGEGKEETEEERKETEKAEEKAVAAGQSASNSHSFKPLRNSSEQRTLSHPGILRSISCELPDPVLATPAGQLFRNKSLKRVSFDDRREIIDEESSCPTPADQSEEDLPPLEEIKTSLEVSESEPLLIEPLASHISRMAGTDDQIAIPVEGVEGEGEQVKKERKPHVKGITFREFDHVKDFEDLVRTVVTLCSQEEQERLREMEDWLVKAEGTWVLAEGFNNFLGKVMHDEAWPSDGRVAMLRLMAYGAGEDDIVLILHMDRKDHLLMNYAQKFDRLPTKEQEALTLLFCNLFETASASEWLLYISEWDAPGGGLPLSNIRVTTKVAVNALLGDTAQVVDYGSALMANLATKEIFDDVCSELAMAILQFFQGTPKEEHVFRCMKALFKFCTIGGRDVPQLVKMIGPDPAKFKGLSPRVDEALTPLSAKLASVPMF